jgi:hypothetical protein
MDFGEQRWRLGGWLVAGAGALALVAAGQSAVWADQSNDNSTTTTVIGNPLVGPITGALQVNLACPANVNLLADQTCSPTRPTRAPARRARRATATRRRRPPWEGRWWLRSPRRGRST